MDGIQDNQGGGVYPRRKKIFFALGGIILSLLLIEIGFHVAQPFLRYGRFKSERDRELDNRATLATYSGKNWTKPYYEELKHTASTFDPLVGWRPTEFHGKYLNMNKDGTRKTWNPEKISGKVIKIFMFGGSTMLGAGAPDDYTVPSYVSQILNSGSPKGVTYMVTNYGQSGYVLVQEIAKLTLLLESGERPDYVVFYDGANDTAYAYQSGVAGIFGSIGIIGDQFRAKLEPTAGERVWNWTKDLAKEYCFSCRIVFDAIRKFSPQFLNPNVVVGQGLSDKELTKLADKIVAEYKTNTLSYLNGLQKAFGFKLAAFWQPTIYTETKLIGEENSLGKIDPHVDDKTAKTLFIEVDKLMKNDPSLNFYNISDVLFGRTHEYYVDYAHVSDEGDRAVAERMVEILKKDYGIR